MVNNLREVTMRCKCCDVRLEPSNYSDYCDVCVQASDDDTTEFKDKQHALITDAEFCEKNKPRKPVR